ncbi:hypothetical protein L6R50_06350 [Myxococcota bacterium]|nr:hypothetical protein [Myxococcota bacterium]
MDLPDDAHRSARHRRDMGLGLVTTAALIRLATVPMANTGFRFEIRLIAELCLLLGAAMAAWGWWASRRT